MQEDQPGQPFLSTLRAVSVCGREFTRLTDGIAERATSSFGDAIDFKIAIRRTPERCIIQLGPSALTVAFIRSRRDSAEGELLVIYWRGTVAPSVRSQPERAIQPALSAEALSESVYVAEATSEADWIWRSREEPINNYTSLSLADHIVDRLRAVHNSVRSKLTA